MLYDSENRKVCALCEHARDFNDDILLCCKHGPVSFDHSCRHFCYDPLRRKPEGPAPLRELPSSDAFQL